MGFNPFVGSGNGGGGGTDNYNSLSNKPKVNGVELKGNKSLVDLGILFGSSLVAEIDSSTYIVTLTLKDQEGNTLGEPQSFDLPLESVVVGGRYDDTTKKFILTLQNGNTVEFSVADLVAGLQSELSSTNKLNPDFINYNSTHRAVSDTEKSTWNGKQNALTFDNTPTNGSSNPVTSGGVYTSLTTKVDKVAGKGLSTNDFTDEDKEQITTNKNNILYNIKDGVQNIFKLAAGTRTAGGVTFTINSDGVITLSNTATSDAVFIISDNLNVSDDTYVLYGDGFVSGIFMDTYEAGYTNRRTFTTYAVTNSNTKIWRLIVSSGTNVNGVTIRPMMCLKSLYDANPSYQPYAMSNAELTQSIEPIPRLVNAGAKNLFSVNAVIFSGQGIGEVFPVNIPAGDYMFSCNCSATTSTSHLYLFDENDTELLHQPFTNNNNKKINITVATQVAFARIDSDVKNTISNIMLCTAEDYAISPKFVPYAMSNAELTAKEQQLENDILSIHADWPTYAIRNNATSFTFNVPTNGTHFRYGLLIGGTSAGNLYFSFIYIGANDAVTLFDVIGQGSTAMSASYSNGVLTITATATIYGGLRLIWLD